MERVIRAHRTIVLCAVAAVVLLAALYTVFGVGMPMTAVDMTSMARPLGEPMAMGQARAWTPAYAALIFLMWWMMMIAMMTPAAAPTLLLFAALKRQGPERRQTSEYALVFLSGYLLAWAGFSTVAAGTQWALQPLGLISAQMMTLNSRLLAGAILLAAGLYQFTPFKQACLRHCRSPAQFLTRHHRPGKSGALAMGAHHGAFCLGCCWALMALLFVGGIMNLYWIAGLAIYVALEKLAPRGDILARLTGVGLIAVGLYFLISGVRAV